LDMISCQCSHQRHGSIVASNLASDLRMEKTVAAFFGIDAHNMKTFLDHGVVCMEKAEGKEAVLLNTFRSIRKEDVIFIKEFSHQTGLSVKAAGIVLSDYPTENDFGICLPVEWAWKGEKVIEEFGEEGPLCSDPLYEEFNIWVQKKLMELLPGKFDLPEEW